LTDYQVNLLNNAAYLQWEFSPIEKMQVVSGIRYDRVDYLYNNHLPVSAFSGAPDSRNRFSFVTPKIGLTYDLGKGAGMYANVSAGAYAPGVGELYRGVKTPVLQPARFSNYEIGGWAALLETKLRAEVSLYQMNGTNEIVSFLLPDNSTENRNSGKTLHRGIEYSFTYAPSQELAFRFGGTNALHKYLVYATKEGAGFDNNSMPNAPTWIANSEINYKPAYLPGLRLMLEWQRIGSWYTDDANRYSYEDRTLFNLKGVSTLNLRAAYSIKNLELYTNITNLTDEMYAHNVSRGKWGATYSPAAGRTFAMGMTYTFTGKK
jgi:outer membrane receptor protein involved in Fe transport